MARPRDALFVAAFALECLAAWAALRGEIGVSLALHACSAASVALGPGRTLVQGRAGWSLAFVLAMLIPACGVVGVWIASRFGEATALQPHPSWIRTKIPTATEARAAARDPLRVQTPTPSHRDPIAKLHRALKDPNEDQRLVAHAILESKSRAAYRAVHEADCAVAAAPEGSRAAQHLRLAARHFDLVRLGLAEGDCLDAALSQGRKHTCAALDEDQRDRSAHFLLGRIELQRGKAYEAEEALDRAVQLGMPDAIARPYLAEAAFQRGRFDLVRRHFQLVPSHSNATVERMRRYWL